MFRVRSEHRSDSHRPTVFNGNGHSIAAVLRPPKVADVDACELQHRMKNIMSVVQSLCRQTMKQTSSKEQFDKEFTGRLMSYSNSVNMLIANNWRGLQIHDLIRSQLATFGPLEGGQFVSAGPPLRISEQGAHSLGLALHELATNAIKYGSLSEPEGRVAITWSVTGADKGPRFRIRWVEFGGPVVAPPARWGFGHQIIQDLSAHALSGQTSYEFLPEGVRWSLDAPARSVVIDCSTVGLVRHRQVSSKGTLVSRRKKCPSARHTRAPAHLPALRQASYQLAAFLMLIWISISAVWRESVLFWPVVGGGRVLAHHR